jgi:hypothetical protein
MAARRPERAACELESLKNLRRLERRRCERAKQRARARASEAGEVAERRLQQVGVQIRRHGRIASICCFLQRRSAAVATLARFVSYRRHQARRHHQRRHQQHTAAIDINIDIDFDINIIRFVSGDSPRPWRSPGPPSAAPTMQIKSHTDNADKLHFPLKASRPLSGGLRVRAPSASSATAAPVCVCVSNARRRRRTKINGGRQLGTFQNRRRAAFHHRHLCRRSRPAAAAGSFGCKLRSPCARVRSSRSRSATAFACVPKASFN